MIDPLVTNPSAREVIDTVNEVVEAVNTVGVGGIPEAPIDTKVYGRQDAAWVEVTGVGGGLPIQALDLVVEVTSDAEYAAAVANYWNYQFTVEARYIIQFQTGYTITMQLSLDSRHMPNLEFRTQTTTTVDCAGFVANALGIKTPFLFVNSELAAFYGTFVGTNGATTSPLVVLGCRMDFWNGNLLAPQALNMSGFTASGGGAGGIQLFGWEQRVPYLTGTTITTDVHLNINTTALKGMKFKIGNGESTFVSCSGDVQIETTAGTEGTISSQRSDITVSLTHNSTAKFLLQTAVAGGMEVMVVSGGSWTPKTGYPSIIDVGGATHMDMYFLNNPTWYPQSAADRFVDVNSSGAFHAYGGTVTINTAVATPNFFMRAREGSSVYHNLTLTDIFPAGAYTTDNSTSIIEGEVTSKGVLVATRREDDSWLEVVPTEAGTSTPDYYPVNLSIEPGAALTATTIDLTNYAKDGLTTVIAFDAYAITGVTWAGGTFVGAPAAIAGGEVKNVTYRSSNSTFYFS